MKSQVGDALAIALAFVLGASAMWFYRGSQTPALPPTLDEPFFDGMFDDRFFSNSRDPFQEMERLRKQMDWGGGFDRWFDDRFGEFSPQTIKVSESRDAITYVLETDGKELVDLKVDVAGGMVSIEAEMRSSADGAATVSTVRQRFPVPAGVNAQAFTIDQSGTNAKIRFPKT